MDYVVGSIAALISGNVTPNRPKLIRRALTPTKHPASPNVTPKSEAVDDRSIFLSPSVQKKKAIVKKSPKRIFENPDLDVTENLASNSPKAEKVKKHLAEDLDDTMNKSGSSLSPSSKLNKSVEASPSKKSKMNNSQACNERTPKKNKRNSKSEIPTEDTVAKDSKSPKPVDQMAEQTDKTESTKNQTPKKNKRKSQDNFKIEEMRVDQTGEKKSPKKKLILGKHVENKENNIEPTTNTPTNNSNEQNSKKKNKKRKKKATPGNQDSLNSAKQISTDETKSKDTTEANTEPKSKKKKKNNKNKKPAIDTEVKPDEIEAKPDDHDDDDDDSETEEVSNIANPNAITEKDSDSEHESDDEIESDNETSNAEALKTEEAAESSDEDVPKNAKKAKKTDETPTAEGTQEVTEDEIKRTLFVGNVPFSNKCKKEIKRIFTKYGDIETVRIRTIPVKDGRVTPKLAVIKNEIHPDRSTVNVYIKFADADSVEMALAENNTVLNKHHLRVSRSAATGAEHDPARAVFVGNLPFGVEDETLRAKFEGCGPVQSVRIVRDKKTNAGKGFGYVNFESKDGVELALNLSEEDLTIKNRIIRVKRCTQTLSQGGKKPSQVQQRNQSQGQNRNFGNQGTNRSQGQGQNRHFGNQGDNRNFQNQSGQGNRNFGNQQRSFGNQQRSFGNQQRSFGNQGGNSFGNQGRSFNQQNKNFGGAEGEASGAARRLMNKRPNQLSGEAPPSKRQNLSQPPREKKQRKEFVGVTAEKKKKQKFDKGQKKRKAISEIMTKKS